MEDSRIGPFDKGQHRRAPGDMAKATGHVGTSCFTPSQEKRGLSALEDK